MLKRKNKLIPLLIVLSAIFILSVTAAFVLPLLIQTNIISDSKVLPAYAYNEPYGTLTQNQSKKWVETGNPLQGAQYDGEIHNPTSFDIISWYIQFEVPERAYISDSWNGNYTREGNIITVEPPKDYNRKIPMGGSITYGFIMYAPKSFSSATVTLYYKQQIETSRSWYYYALLILAIVSG